MSLTLTNLPKFIKFKILLCLPLQNLARTFQVSKSFYDISQNEDFWRSKLLNDKPDHLNSKHITVSNKDHYLLFIPKYVEYKTKQLTALYNNMVTNNQFILIGVKQDDNDAGRICEECYDDDYYIILNYIGYNNFKYVCKTCLHKQELDVGCRWLAKNTIPFKF